MAAVRPARPARAHLRRAVRRRRDGRGRARHRDGVIRPVAGARAVLRDRGARRDAGVAGRHAGAEVGHPAAGGGGRAAARLRLRRAGHPLVADRHRHHRRSVRGHGGRVDGLRREDRGARRRQRRHADRQRGHARRDRPVPGRRGRRLGRRATPCRTASAAGTCCWPTRPRQLLGTSADAIDAHLDRDRRRDGGAVRRVDRGLRADAVDDRRLPEDAGAVRPADRGVPGAAVPRGGHVRRARAGPVDGAAGPAVA